MAKEKRKKIKMLQFRVTEENFNLFEEKAKKLGISKTKLFEKLFDTLRK